MDRERSLSAERLATAAVHAAFTLYHDLGPGILESVYERILEAEFTRLGFHVQRQQSMQLSYHDLVFPHAFRPDMILNGLLLLEVKSVDTVSAIHVKQTLTYLRLLDLPLGLLLNFGAERFKGVVRRVVNGHDAGTAFADRRIFAH